MFRLPVKQLALALGARAFSDTAHAVVNVLLTLRANGYLPAIRTGCADIPYIPYIIPHFPYLPDTGFR
jgi:hypothetical protein